jgi:hypothetical protein
MLLTFVTDFLCIFANEKVETAIQCFVDYVTTEKRLAASTCRYYEDEAGNVYIVRRGILTIVAANGKVY